MLAGGNSGFNRGILPFAARKVDVRIAMSVYSPLLMAQITNAIRSARYMAMAMCTHAMPWSALEDISR